ncbi:hypothetical protein, partial [Flavobacterium sp.]|uniref:hypothetical protein n=1 Tax=Flavobacterium sp. TaxID=239 RepID=UPI0037C0C2E6
MSYYTGIGSRKTPEDMLKKLRYVGKQLAKAGFILRSGAAEGADTAFEQGCDSVAGGKEIYLGWNGFSGRFIKGFEPPSPESYELASTLHPYWNNLKQGAKALHARNTYQV